VKDFPDVPGYGLSSCGTAHALLGQRQEALAYYDRLGKVEPSSARMALADLAIAEGRLSDAGQLLNEEIADDKDDPAAVASAWAVLGELRLRQGDKVQGLKAAGMADREPTASTSYVVGVTYARAGQPKKASAIAARLRAALSAERRSYASLIDADVLRATGKSRDAVAVLEQSLRDWEDWLTHLTLAQAYIDIGAFIEATSELGICQTRRGEGVGEVDATGPSLRYVALVPYYMGRAKEGLGNPDAAGSYRAFLAQQHGDDPDPLTADARRGLVVDPKARVK
jgi:tetratricopeptide (TPR) repeat protein